MTDRLSTPPPPMRGSGVQQPSSPITPEQVRRTEEARLKAKAARAQHDISRQNTSPAAGQKRPHSLVSSSSSQPNNSRNAASNLSGLSKPAHDGAIRPAKKFEKFIEYDFSKMSDTKGGFLSVDDDPHNKALHATSEPPAVEKPAHMTLEEWERHQLLTKLRASRAGPFEPGISILNEKEKNKICRECGGLEIDWSWLDIFACAVCSTCKEKYPHKYSLLTKTEAREDYLLTDPELKDTELLPRLERPNPHKSTWNNMQLYLRYQVEEYAFSDKKWGSPEALDVEFERREDEKKARKDKKFKSRLEELKKKTRAEAYRRSRKSEGSGDAQFGTKIVGRNDRHIHEWGRSLLDPETGVQSKRCVECGMECEEYEL